MPELKPLNTEQITKINAVVDEVQGGVNIVVGILGAAGVGGNLNETDAIRLSNALVDLAQRGLTAYAVAHEIEIDHESILALLPASKETPTPEQLHGGGESQSEQKGEETKDEAQQQPSEEQSSTTSEASEQSSS
jgi:hypothetical protein